MDLDRFAEDSPDDDAPGESSVCVVATQSDTFERCRDGVYPSPQSYPRTRRSFEYMAFYRTAPVSSVTHYARVTDRVSQTRGHPGPMDDADWRALIDPFSEEDEVVVFMLEELVPLDTPVGNNRNGVRGAWYCTIADLRDASTPTESHWQPSRASSIRARGRSRRRVPERGPQREGVLQSALYV